MHTALAVDHGEQAMARLVRARQTCFPHNSAPMALRLVPRRALSASFCTRLRRVAGRSVAPPSMLECPGDLNRKSSPKPLTTALVPPKSAHLGPCAAQCSLRSPKPSSHYGVCSVLVAALVGDLACLPRGDKPGRWDNATCRGQAIERATVHPSPCTDLSADLKPDRASTQKRRGTHARIGVWACLSVCPSVCHAFVCARVRARACIGASSKHRRADTCGIIARRGGGMLERQRARLVVFSDFAPDAIDLLHRRGLQMVIHHVLQDAHESIPLRPKMHRVHDVWGEHLQPRARQGPLRMVIRLAFGMALVGQTCMAPLRLLTAVCPGSVGTVGGRKGDSNQGMRN